MRINCAILIILFFIAGCNKENTNHINVTHDMLNGKWLLEKETISTKYMGSINNDTNIYSIQDTLEFDTSFYCKINSTSYAWDLHSDTISICSCPVYMICDPIIFYSYYKIIGFDARNEEMILKEEIGIKYPSNANGINGTEIIIKYYRKIIYLR